MRYFPITFRQCLVFAGLLLAMCGLITSGPASAIAAEPTVELVAGAWLKGEQAGADAKSPLKAPFGVDFDPAGTMWLVELGGGRVWTLSNDGQLRHVSGNGDKGYSGDGGVMRDAVFNGMHNVAVDSIGDVYIADSWNHAIRKIDHASGVITTIAGTGDAGFSGDGGHATAATFDFVMCISLNATNDKIYIADLNNHRIRVLDLASGIVNTIAGNGAKGVPTDGAVATDAPLVDPRAVAADASGNIYVLERSGNALRVVTPDGRIRTVAGTGKKGANDGPALQATFGSPKHLCVDGQGRVFIADDANGRVRMFDPMTNMVTTVLGAGQGSPAVTLKNPHGVCVQGNDLYVVDMGHDRVLKVPLP